jgi:hypothetical protein
VEYCGNDPGQSRAVNCPSRCWPPLFLVVSRIRSGDERLRVQPAYPHSLRPASVPPPSRAPIVEPPIYRLRCSSARSRTLLHVLFSYDTHRTPHLAEVSIPLALPLDQPVPVLAQREQLGIAHRMVRYLSTRRPNAADRRLFQTRARGRGPIRETPASVDHLQVPASKP